MLTETDIIARYFRQPGLCADPLTHPGVALGIGDDCALLSAPPGSALAVTMDVLVADVHFPADADPELVAQRALAVNLSDLAAMGARPLGFTLGLTLSAVDETWLSAFSKGLRISAMRYACPLLGGNLTKGPLQICIQAHGLVDAGKALLRSGASPGDDVYVSGSTGRAGLALALLQGTLSGVTTEHQQELLSAYYQPVPQLKLGMALQGLASAAQDVSDGVLQDLEHIARNSGVGITVDASAVPIAAVLGALQSPAAALALALTAGDDYELVFTAPASRRTAIAAAAGKAGVSATRIGQVSTGSGVQVLDADGTCVRFDRKGYQHFAAQ